MEEMNHILDCEYEIKLSYDPCSCQHNFSNTVERPFKIQDFSREAVTHDDSAML